MEDDDDDSVQVAMREWSMNMPHSIKILCRSLAPGDKVQVYPMKNIDIPLIIEAAERKYCNRICFRFNTTITFTFECIIYSLSLKAHKDSDSDDIITRDDMRMFIYRYSA